MMTTHNFDYIVIGAGLRRRGAGGPAETESVATRVMFERQRATGVEYQQGGRVVRAYAEHEVVLAAGPIKSPQLLELSGVGDGVLLQKLGVPVVHHLPGVGENLIDHLQSRLTYACTRPITLNEILASPLRQGWMGAKYLASRRGLMATPACTVHALARTSSDQSRPSVKLQLHHLSGTDRYATAKGYGLDDYPGFTIGFFKLRPASRGSVHARSPHAQEHPAIDPRYLSEESDRQVTLDALRLARTVMRQPAIARYVERETRPGIDVFADDDLLAYIRESAQTSWHPVGTCRMGTDAMAVVDPMLRVHGVSALRVVDSSIMPTIPASNTNAASIMIGEKAADLMLRPQPAAPSTTLPVVERSTDVLRADA